MNNLNKFLNKNKGNKIIKRNIKNTTTNINNNNVVLNTTSIKKPSIVEESKKPSIVEESKKPSIVEENKTYNFKIDEKTNLRELYNKLKEDFKNNIIDEKTYKKCLKKLNNEKILQRSYKKDYIEGIKFLNLQYKYNMINKATLNKGIKELQKIEFNTHNGIFNNVEFLNTTLGGKKAYYKAYIKIDNNIISLYSWNNRIFELKRSNDYLEFKILHGFKPLKSCKYDNKDYLNLNKDELDNCLLFSSSTYQHIKQFLNKSNCFNFDKVDNKKITNKEKILLLNNCRFDLNKKEWINKNNEVIIKL